MERGIQAKGCGKTTTATKIEMLATVSLISEISQSVWVLTPPNYRSFRKWRCPACVSATLIAHTREARRAPDLSNDVLLPQDRAKSDDDDMSETGESNALAPEEILSHRVET